MKNHYEIFGDTTKIFVNRGGIVVSILIDTSDFELIRRFTWCLMYTNTGREPYALSSISKPGGGRTSVLMHRIITNAPKNKLVDHINHNGRDNRRKNLRLVSQSENQQNRAALQTNNSSGFRGVYFNKKRNAWVANATFNKKTIYLGAFPDKISAAIVASDFRKDKMPFSDEAMFMPAPTIQIERR